MLCKWMKMKYLKRYYGQTLQVNKDVANQSQAGLTGYRKTQGSWVVEIGWQVQRIEVTGDICSSRPRPTQDCRATAAAADDDDDSDDDTYPFKRRVKSHLPSADIIRSSPYSPH